MILIALIYHLNSCIWNVSMAEELAQWVTGFVLKAWGLKLEIQTRLRAPVISVLGCEVRQVPRTHCPASLAEIASLQVGEYQQQ